MRNVSWTPKATISYEQSGARRYCNTFSSSLVSASRYTFAFTPVLPGSDGSSTSQIQSRKYNCPSRASHIESWSVCLPVNLSFPPLFLSAQVETWIKLVCCPPLVPRVTAWTTWDVLYRTAAAPPFSLPIPTTGGKGRELRWCGGRNCQSID